MTHPSIKLRLIFGSTLLLAGVLLYSKVAMYREIERSLRQDFDDRLLHSANLLSKSAELEAGGVIYEWQEALESTSGLEIEGLFQFWNLMDGATKPSIWPMENRPARSASITCPSRMNTGARKCSGAGISSNRRTIRR